MAKNDKESYRNSRISIQRKTASTDDDSSPRDLEEAPFPSSVHQFQNEHTRHLDHHTMPLAKGKTCLLGSGSYQWIQNQVHQHREPSRVLKFSFKYPKAFREQIENSIQFQTPQPEPEQSGQETLTNHVQGTCLSIKDQTTECSKLLYHQGDPQAITHL